MSGITFGSVGDIIAVGQIACALAKTLNDSRGSAKEYQGLVKELQTFDQALLQVVALWQNYENSPELDELGKITRNTVNEWREILLAFRLKVDKKYGTTLCVAGSGNWFKDASKKVVWLKEKEDILELWRKLGLASDTITVLILAAMGKSNKLDSTAQTVRVQLVHSLLQESIRRAEEQVSKLKIMDEKLDSQVKTSELILSSVKSGATYLAQIPSVAIDLKCILGLIQGQIMLQPTTPKGIGNTWQQAPVTLEDALGFVYLIPLELVNSWDMFDMIITKRFEKHPGHGKVLKGEFAIEEDATGRELSRKSDWSFYFRPGQKVDMSMLFSELESNSNECPRCRTKSSASLGTRTQCANCKMWFQRVEEVDESDLYAYISPESQIDQDELDQIPSSGVKRQKAPTSVRPEDFERVRLMRNPSTEPGAGKEDTPSGEGGTSTSSSNLPSAIRRPFFSQFLVDVDKKFEELVDVSLRRLGIVPPHPRSYLDTVERGLPPSTRGFDRIPRFTPNGDPSQITEPRGYGRVPSIQLRTPPESKPVKGILRKPREKFPEDPDPIREVVVPPKDVRKDGIPPPPPCYMDQDK